MTSVVAPLQVGDRVGPGEPVGVRAAAVAAFGEALGAGPVPGGRLAPVGGLAPATMVVAVALGAEGGPVDLLAPQVSAGSAVAVVHGDQQLTVHRPVRVGDRLRFASTVRTVRRLPGATVVVVVTDVTGITDLSEVAGELGVRATGIDGEVVADLQATFVLSDPPAAPDLPATPSDGTSA